MEIGERPVHQVHVEIIQTEVCQRFAACQDDVVRRVFVVPKLRGDPQLLTPDSLGEERLQRGSDAFFVAVDRRAIQVAISR